MKSNYNLYYRDIQQYYKSPAYTDLYLAQDFKLRKQKETKDNNNSEEDPNQLENSTPGGYLYFRLKRKLTECLQQLTEVGIN